jgi:hypothetical protein
MTSGLRCPGVGERDLVSVDVADTHEHRREVFVLD